MARTCNLLQHPLPLGGWGGWGKLATLHWRDLRGPWIKARDFISLENQGWQWLRFLVICTLKQSKCISQFHAVSSLTVVFLPVLPSISLPLLLANWETCRAVIALWQIRSKWPVIILDQWPISRNRDRQTDRQTPVYCRSKSTSQCAAKAEQTDHPNHLLYQPSKSW